MKQDGYQVTSDIVAKSDADTKNTMRLTSDMDRIQPIDNKDMTKLNTKVKLPLDLREEPKDIIKAVKGK